MNKGISLILAVVMIVAVVILAVVAIVSYSRMWKAAANMDFLSAASSYSVSIVGIAAVVIGIILILLYKRG